MTTQTMIIKYNPDFIINSGVAGGLLNIKPVIAINNGSIEVVAKARGTKQGNKGFSAMQAAIETANVLRGL